MRADTRGRRHASYTPDGKPSSVEEACPGLRKGTQWTAYWYDRVADPGVLDYGGSAAAIAARGVHTMDAPDEYRMWLERALTGKNVSELERAYEELLKEVKRVDPLTLAEQAECQYRGDGIPRILVPFLHSWFVLELLPYRLKAQHPILDTLPLKVLVLQHLVTAARNEGTAVRVMGQWIDARSLVHGAILGAHFARTTTDTLQRFFAMSPDERMGRVLAWAGKRLDLGEEGYVFHLFPRLPVALIHWRGDEEFPPYSKVLFDVSASNYMATHGLIALTDFLIHRVAE